MTDTLMAIAAVANAGSVAVGASADQVRSIGAAP
jgi:hypothetical protein